MTSLPTPKAVQIGFSAPLSLPVLLHDVSKSDAARITKLDIETFRDESWKPNVLWSQKIKVTSYKKHRRRGSLHSCECWLLLVYLSVANFEQTTRVK